MHSSIWHHCLSSKFLNAEFIAHISFSDNPILELFQLTSLMFIPLHLFLSKHDYAKLNLTISLDQELDRKREATNTGHIKKL